MQPSISDHLNKKSKERLINDFLTDFLFAVRRRLPCVLRVVGVDRLFLGRGEAFRFVMAMQYRDAARSNQSKP